MIALPMERTISDCRRSNGPAARIHGAERAGADGSERNSILRPCICIPWPSRRSDQNAVVGWRRAVQSHDEKPTVSPLRQGSSAIRGILGMAEVF